MPDKHEPPDPPEDIGGANKEEDDFARMLEQSLAPKSYREGETVTGTIVAVGADVAFVDVGGKGEATIALEELVDPDSDVEVKVGDTVKAIVVSTVGGLKLSHKLARGAATRQLLEDAWRSGLPVEGRVEKAIKGGFEIRLAGERAFCPISQIEAGFTHEPEAHVGQVYTFLIMECREGGKNLVVSRRRLIEEEEKERAEEIRRAAVPEAVLTGRVMSVRPFGAFVDLGGGVQGLLHVSEMGWSRVEDPGHLVQVGDAITVKVLRVEQDTGKIALGLKQLQTDPWSNLEDRYRVGQLLQGTVTRLAEFGAFVELEPGIEALAHVSTFAPTGKRDGWKEAAVPGGTVAIEILSIEPGRRRIGVAILEEGSARARRAGAAAKGEAGAEAAGEAGAMGAGEAGESRVMSDEVARQDGTQAEGFGSLADKLRAALRPKRD